MGKGSTPRPFDVTQEEFANRFDAIFKKPKPAPEPEVPVVEGKKEKERSR